jgi:hypothetical protein
MTMQQEALFEAPASHEGHPYSQELSQEQAFSWESHEGAFEDEWTGEGSFEGAFEDEDELAGGYESMELGSLPSYEGGFGESSLGYETGFEQGFESAFEGGLESSLEGGYEADPFLGGLLNTIGSAIGLEASMEYGESDQFFGKVLKAVKKVAQRALPIATKFLAPMVPGGAIAAGIASQLLKEGSQEAASLEAALFSPEAAFETGSHEQALEAALTEVLAAEAAGTPSEAEASSVIAATLPITITIMGGRSALRPVVPTLAQANGRLVTAFRRQGPVGSQLIRTIPAIQRRAVGTLRVAARRGQPITGPLAVRAMHGATRSVLGNPRTLRRVLAQNAAVTARSASRPGAGVPRRSGYRTVAYGGTPRRRGY